MSGRGQERCKNVPKGVKRWMFNTVNKSRYVNISHDVNITRCKCLQGVNISYNMNYILSHGVNRVIICVSK